jgi:hypothetical protein
METGFSDRQTSWAVLCSQHGQVFLTASEYDFQMQHANLTWTCPRCGRDAEWDDDHHEQYCED